MSSEYPADTQNYAKEGSSISLSFGSDRGGLFEV